MYKWLDFIWQLQQSISEKETFEESNKSLVEKLKSFENSSAPSAQDIADEIKNLNEMITSLEEEKSQLELKQDALVSILFQFHGF